MSVILDLPKPFMSVLEERGFDVTWNVVRAAIEVTIEPFNAIELERLAQILQVEGVE